MIIAPSSTSASFSVSQAQILLISKERRSFQIKFMPTSHGPAVDKLIIVGLGGEVYKVTLEGFGGHSVKVLDTKIDFGPTDIFYDPIERRVFLENKDDSHVLYLGHDATTKEVTFNNGEPLVIQPRERKKVDVRFHSELTGERQEELHIYAPNSILPAVDLHAFSGPAICVPIMEEILFPTTLTSFPCSVHFPITNLSGATSQCLVSLPPMSPFAFHILDPEYSNRKTLERSSLIIEMKPFEGPDSTGVLVTIGPRLTAVLEIIFKSSTWGTFRVPLTTQMLKPRKWTISTHYLSAIAINEVYLSRENPLEMIRRFLKRPRSEPTTGLLLKKTPEAKALDAGPLKSSEVFELEPNPQICFGSSLKDSPAGTYEFVTLSNLTVKMQKYHIALSFPFYTTIPLDGELEALASLEIPIHVDSAAYSAHAAVDTGDFVSLGQITVFDQHQKMGMVSSSLFGTISDLLGVEIRKDTGSISFPPLRVMEKYTRRIYIHNKAPFEVIWEGRITLRTNNLFENNLQNTQTPLPDWCPFGLGSTRVSLKPYEYGTIDVMFQATSSGEFRSRLLMDYIDPVLHISNNEYQKTRVKRPLAPVDFSCLVGLADVDVDCEVIHFGDVITGDVQQRQICLTNDQNLDAHVIIFAEAPFGVPTPWLLVPKGVKTDVQVRFQSMLPRSYCDFLSVTCGKQTRVVTMLANSGTSALTANLAEPIKLESAAVQMLPKSPSNVIDFGMVGTVNPKYKLFILQNVGTFELTVKNIVVGDDNHLSWKFADENDAQMGSLLKTEDSEGYWDAPEVDWDEFDTKNRDEKPNGAVVLLNPSSVDLAKLHANGPTMATNKRRRVKSLSYNAGPIVANLHKNFPLRLPPNQMLRLLLSFGGFEKVGSIVGYIG
ncbi:hypothetical protein HK101_004835 [Irineochytrium annulatum]|nr:hypothetical protein HK101_004835 [Irineochytrium annulatum]